MTRLPRLKGKEIVRLLQRIGFRIVRTRGSHVLPVHTDEATMIFLVLSRSGDIISFMAKRNVRFVATKTVKKPATVKLRRNQARQSLSGHSRRSNGRKLFIFAPKRNEAHLP